MKKIISSVLFLNLFLIICSLALGTETQNLQCAICGMETKTGSKTSFESRRDGKPVRFCSFSCAHAFRKKYPNEKLMMNDFETGKPIDAKSAFFLANSENLLKELEFGMPPAIVAFEKEGSAKKVKARLKDGEIVNGLESLEKKYE